MANPLFSQQNSTGTSQQDARAMASATGPRLEAPSPTKYTTMSFVFFSFWVRAAPTATPASDPRMPDMPRM